MSQNIGVPVGPESTRMTCPQCHSAISTSTKTEPGMKAYLIGGLLALFGCVCGCCLIPCCMNSCRDVHHSCPKCNAFLGRFRR